MFDLEANTISLPPKKSQHSSYSYDCLSCVQATHQELASLTGKLRWASHVIQPGYLFLNRVLATKRWASTYLSVMFLDASFMADLFWWRSSHVSINGTSFLVSMDASSSGWFGGIPGLTGVNQDTG